jgi:hypothetical protein
MHRTNFRALPTDLADLHGFCFRPIRGCAKKNLCRNLILRGSITHELIRSAVCVYIYISGSIHGTDLELSLHDLCVCHSKMGYSVEDNSPHLGDYPAINLSLRGYKLRQQLSEYRVVTNTIM